MNPAMIHSEASLELKYQDIMMLFEMADQLIAKAETAANPEQYVEEVEALVEAVVDTADTLSEEFFIIINGKQSGKQTSKGKIETALRKSYTALNLFSKKASEATRKHAARLVNKLKRQLEVVIASVVDFVALSLDRIMQKQDIEEIKQRQVRIAQMLHNMAQHQAAT